MKNIIKKSLTLSAVIITTVFGMSWFINGYREEIGLVFKLIILSCAIIILQYFIGKISFKYYLLNIVIEYLSISSLVLIFGILSNWFLKSNWWMMFLYVGIVYVIGFFLDMVIVKKDIEYINSKLESRREKNKNELHE